MYLPCFLEVDELFKKGLEEVDEIEIHQRF
jgi:hypothetical protein